MSGFEIPAALAATGTGTAAAPVVAGTVGGISAIPIGTSTALGTGAMGGATTLGSAGGSLGGAAGLTSAGTTAGGITGVTAPGAFGTVGGMGEMALVPGLEGASGTGLLANASASPELSAMFASAANPSTFSTPFTVGDLLGKVGKGADYYGKANSAVKLMQPPQQAGMIDPGPGTFEGRQRQPISPFGQTQGNENSFARYLMQRRMNGRNINGLLG